MVSNPVPSHTTGAAGQDWYTVLGLERTATDAAVGDAVERLSRQASALANTAPDRSQQMRDTVRAIRADLLSGPATRATYDGRLAGPAPQGPPALSPAAHDAVAQPRPPSPPAAGPDGAPGVAAGAGTYGGPAPGGPGVVDSVVAGIAPVVSRFRRFLQTGWTCPNCGAEGGPGTRFCAKCGGPMKSAEQPAPAPSARPRCAGCSAPLGAGARFCSQCGTPAP
jgi:hypothetical protein